MNVTIGGVAGVGGRSQPDSKLPLDKPSTSVRCIARKRERVGKMKRRSKKEQRGYTHDQCGRWVILKNCHTSHLVKTDY
jgi:hypothetical protein